MGKKPVDICKVTPSEQRFKPSKAHEGARCSSWVTWHCRYWFYPTWLWWLRYVNPIFQKSVPTPSKPIISLFAKSEITSHLSPHICSYLLILDFPVLVLCSALCHFCYWPRSTYSFPGHNYLWAPSRRTSCPKKLLTKYPNKWLEAPRLTSKFPLNWRLTGPGWWKPGWLLPMPALGLVLLTITLC